MARSEVSPTMQLVEVLNRSAERDRAATAELRAFAATLTGPRVSQEEADRRYAEAFKVLDDLPRHKAQRDHA